jgi:O-antigen/teichoic acid export membrane protein
VKKIYQGAKLNALSQYVNFLVGSIASLLVSPVLARYLGANDFGVLKSCQKYLDFASVADGRATQALKWIIARKEGETSDDADKQRAVGSALVVWFMFLPLFVIIVSLIVYLIPYSIRDARPEDLQKIRLTSAILGLNILLTPLMGIPDAVLVGLNRAHKSTVIQTLWLVISNILMAVTAIKGWGIVGVSVVMTGISIFKGVSVLSACRSSVEWFKIKMPTKSQITDFFTFSFGTLIWSLVSMMMLSTETLLIGYFCGSGKVTEYTFTSYIAVLGSSIALVTTSSMMPGLAIFRGASDLESSVNIVNSVRKWVFCIGVFFLACIIGLNDIFVRVWAGGSFFLGRENSLLVGLLMLQLIMIRNEAQIQDTTLDISKRVRIGVLCSIASVILGFAFYRIFEGSLSALFVGVLIGRFAMSWIFPRMVNRATGCRCNLQSYHFVGVLVVVICYISSLVVSINGIMASVLYSAIFSILVGAVIFFGMLTKSERSNLLLIVSNIF